jgi:hypothetical protein
LFNLDGVHVIDVGWRAGSGGDQLSLTVDELLAVWPT